jgi:hypothetical protein
MERLADEGLSLTLVQHLESNIPRADSGSAHPLDQALGRLKTARDKAIAHHDMVSHSSVLIPGWPHLLSLLGLARETVVLVADAYLGVRYDLESDARQASRSLRRLLHKAGLEDNVG